MNRLLAWLLEPFDYLLYRWREEREPDSVGFDEAHGTETAAFTWLDEYEPTRPAMLDEALDALELDLSGWTFADLGSGKGRAVFVAAKRDFTRVIGVELAPALHAAAEENLAAITAREALASPVFLYCDDAAAFPIPAGPLVVYLFNPFGQDVLNKVLHGLKGRQELRLIYANPLYTKLVEAYGYVELKRGGEGVHSWRVYRPPGP